MRNRRSQSAVQRLMAFLAIVVAVGCDRSTTDVGQPQNDERVIEVDRVSPEEQKQRLDELFGGTKKMERMRSAKSIVAYRVASRPYDLLTDDLKARVKPGEKIGSFPVLEGPATMSSDDVQQLLKILFDGRYLSSGLDACVIEPGIAVRFKCDDEDTIDVLLCFKCDQIMVLRGRKNFGDQNYALAALLPIFKPLFPNDEGFQQFSK